MITSSNPTAIANPLPVPEPVRERETFKRVLISALPPFSHLHDPLQLTRINLPDMTTAASYMSRLTHLWRGAPIRFSLGLPSWVSAVYKLATASSPSSIEPTSTM